MNSPKLPFAALGRYCLAMTALNFMWEIFQLQLYTLWQTGSKREIAFALMHCTVGDVMIAMITLTLSLIILNAGDWPAKKSFPLKLVTIISGLAYTVLSERINLASGAWTYSVLMPVIPWLEVGVTPALQWLVIPVTAFWFAEKNNQTPYSINS